MTFYSKIIMHPLKCHYGLYTLFHDILFKNHNAPIEMSLVSLYTVLMEKSLHVAFSDRSLTDRLTRTH